MTTQVACPAFSMSKPVLPRRYNCSSNCSKKDSGKSKGLCSPQHLPCPPPRVCVCVCVCDETRLMHCSQSHSGLSLPNPPAMLHAARCTTSARLLPQCDVRSTLGSTRFLVHATSLLWVGACVLVHACGLIFLCACSFNSGLHAWSMFTHKNPTH